MLDWNPSHHTRHAWATTKTVWGKIALVLFYSFIWIQIVSSAISIIWPASQGMQCMLGMDGLSNTTAQTLFIASVRAINIFCIGIMAYADVCGLTVKNVALVTIIFACWALTLTPTVPLAIQAGCMGYFQLWMLPGWVFLALVFTIIEDKLGGPRGNTGETQGLMA